MVAGVGDAVDADQLARLAGAPAGDAADDREAAAQLGQGGARVRPGPPPARGARRSAPACRRCRSGPPRAPGPRATARADPRGSGSREPLTSHLVSPPVAYLNPPVPSRRAAEAGRDRHRGGCVQRPVRGRRRHRDRPAADPLVRLRRAAGDRHEPGGDHPDRAAGGGRAGRLYGNVHLATGLRCRLPAVGGVVVGTALQQRISAARRLAALRRAAGRVAVELIDPVNEVARRRSSAPPAASSAGSSASAAGSSSSRRWRSSSTSQVDAEATSLLMIVFVAIAANDRQRAYGNVNLRDALVIGVLSPLGVLIGVVVANAVPERALELGFAALALFFAFSLFRRALAGSPEHGRRARESTASSRSRSPRSSCAPAAPPGPAASTRTSPPRGSRRSSTSTPRPSLSDTARSGCWRTLGPRVTAVAQDARSQARNRSWRSSGCEAGSRGLRVPKRRRPTRPSRRRGSGGWSRNGAAAAQAGAPARPDS